MNRIDRYNEKRRIDKLHMEIKIKKERARYAYTLVDDPMFDIGDNPFDTPVFTARTYAGLRVG